LSIENETYGVANYHQDGVRSIFLNELVVMQFGEWHGRHAREGTRKMRVTPQTASTPDELHTLNLDSNFLSALEFRVQSRWLITVGTPKAHRPIETRKSSRKDVPFLLNLDKCLAALQEI
jgi:hypothetical protein